MNVLIIGTGHYVTGFKENKEFKSDKDCGVVLPSLFHLKNMGLINSITLAAGNSKKNESIKSHINKWSQGLFSKTFDFEIHPHSGEVDYDAYKKLIDKNIYDAAFVCTPDQTHFNILMSLSRKNIPIFVVKPCVLTLSELYKLNSASKNLIFVDYHKIFDEANVKIFNSIKNNQIGKLLHIHSQQTQKKIMFDQYLPNIKDPPRTFINYYLGSHYIHLTSFLTGAQPISVRTTGQFGEARERSGIDICDLTQTHVTWKLGHDTFSTYHVAGWCDPNHGPSMTYQNIEIIGTKGRISSDQRYRGYSENIDNTGLSEPNPYFFSLDLDYDNNFDPSSNYGYKSILKFLNIVNHGLKPIKFPGLMDSECVTAILEAGELSFTNNSQVIYLNKLQDKFQIGLHNDTTS